jgi:RNA polymerase sigma factor (TIGR02999 family)
MQHVDDLSGAGLCRVDNTRPDRARHFGALYPQLHRIARREARRFGAAAGLSATTLLHETFLQLVARESVDTSSEPHFLACAARAMRSLVIDRLRALGTVKRGGGLRFDSLDAWTSEPLTVLPIASGCERLVAALDELDALDADLAALVELRFFGGYTMAEIASQRGVTERTVQRQWKKARAWLYQAIGGDAGQDASMPAKSNAEADAQPDSDTGAPPA